MRIRIVKSARNDADQEDYEDNLPHGKSSEGTYADMG